MTLNLILALSGEKFESNLISRLSHPASQIRVIDRCLDAAELLAYLRANQVDLVILSVDLPRLSPQVAKELRAITKTLCLVEAGDLDALELAQKLILPSFEVTENFNHLMQSIREFVGNEIPIKKQTESVSELICFCSSSSSPGVSSMAIAFADLVSNSKRVCLIDLSLKTPDLAANLNLNSASSGLALVTHLAMRGELNTAELANRCIQVKQNLRVLPGIPSPNRWSDLDLEAILEVVAVARELDDVVVIDLGGIEFLDTALADKRETWLIEILNLATSKIGVIAGDPISLLRGVNWLSRMNNSLLEDIDILVNKLNSKTIAAEISTILQKSNQKIPVAYIPIDHDLFAEALWVGQPVTALQSKSPAIKALASWIGNPDYKQANMPNKTSWTRPKAPALKRLKEAS